MSFCYLSDFAAVRFDFSYCFEQLVLESCQINIQFEFVLTRQVCIRRSPNLQGVSRRLAQRGKCLLSSEIIF